jgi:hypothetical protein
MKRCSTCNRTYTDPNLSFCIDDGTPLTETQPDDETTVVRSRDTQDEWKDVAYRPPSSYVPPPEVKRRSAWPWIIGILGAFVLGIIAIAIAAAILGPRYLRSNRDEGVSSNVNQPQNANTPEEVNANNTPVDAPPPGDREQVLADLTAIENDWTVANLNADKKKLERILADDFVGKSPDGNLESKADYIRTIQRNNTVDKWEFSEMRLLLMGDRATLTGIITYFVDDRRVAFDFVDKFVWREGRWQATGAEIKERATSEYNL